MIPQQEQEGLIADPLARTPDRVAEAFLYILRHKGDTPPQLQDVVIELFALARELVVVLDGGRGAEKLLEQFEVGALHQDTDLLDPGIDRLFDNRHDDRLDAALAVDHGEELLLDRLGCGEEARPKAGRGDDRLAHTAPRLDRQLQAGLIEVAFDDLNHLTLALLVLRNELGRTVAL